VQHREADEKRKLIGAHKAAFRDDKRHREAGYKRNDDAHEAAARENEQNRDSDEAKAK
jgi:hypothetical protein